ncbi:hypothetical protein [Methanolobus vulcani]|uniref:Uncharacterized protein n=1 Tax=Methanolobus vulcani TaxID=38026 RepID=A0A7Z8KLT3_9EURY|nr:hypothetical protein [Methanolobus vulcani]TQD23813.1 hypothetical protein FKV42_11360 [Methanolobus vulcani]
MNKTRIIMMLVLLFLASSGCTEQDKFTISENATILSMKYVTTSVTDMEIQELVINSSTMDLSIYSLTHQLKAHYTRPMIEYQWKQPPYMLTGKPFLEISSSSEAKKIRPDVIGSGTLEVTVLQDGYIHTVTIDSDSPEYQFEDLYQIEDYMDFQRLLALEPSFEEAQAIVEPWIISMPTYSFDGSNLTLEEHIREDTLPSMHLLIYTFTSSHEGYGDRSNEELTESLTNHTIRVSFSQREITKAIIDGSWDEMKQESV